jgi:hypothetical protein
VKTAPIRVEKLLTAGFGLSRPAVRGMVDSGRIRLPMAIDAKAREDFTLFVITTPPPSLDATADNAGWNPGTGTKPGEPAGDSVSLDSAA